MEGREEGIPVCEVIRQEEQDSRPLGLLRKGDNSFILFDVDFLTRNVGQL